MEAMNGIPPQIPGYTFAQKLGSGSEANVYLYQQLSPSDKWPSKSARERSIRARRRGSVPKRTSWAGSPRIPTFFRCTKAASPPQATATPYSNTLREAITRPSWNPTGSTQTRCSPSASIWRAPFHSAPRRHHHRDIKPSNILINTHGMPMLSDFGIAGTIYGRPGIGYTIAWLRRKCSQRTAEATNPPIFIRWEQRCSPC